MKSLLERIGDVEAAHADNPACLADMAEARRAVTDWRGWRRAERNAAGAGHKANAAFEAMLAKQRAEGLIESWEA